MSALRRALPSLVVWMALCSVVSLLRSVEATDVLPPHARNGRLWALLQSENQGLFTRPTAAQWFTQQVDHFADASDSGGDPTTNKTFQQRFYEVNTHWRSPDGPVLLYIGGEGALTRAPSGFIDVLAQRFGAKIVALEHRFYGDSIPNGVLTTQNYRFLTVQQALADLKHFKEQYEATLPQPGSNKWIAVGGSYPGALSAWFRVAYPDTTIASLSSSGVVLPVFAFEGFDQQVAQSAGPACANVLRKTTKIFENAIKSGNGTIVKRLLGAQDLCDADFFYMIADAAAMAVQYGHKDTVCDKMLAADAAQESLMEAFAAFTIDMYGESFGSGCFYDTNCLVNDPTRWADVRSWRWQKCSQLAYFQVAPASGSVRSSLVNLDYHVKQCEAVFGDVVDPKRGVEDIIALYGGASPKAHNIFFSNGGDDPWQRASVLSSLAEDEPANVAHCDLCGHCGDLGANTNVPEPLKQQRLEILSYMTKWLQEASVNETDTEIDHDAPVTVAMDLTPSKLNDAVESPRVAKEIYHSSPLVLLPVALAIVALALVVHFDIIRDLPLTRRRQGYLHVEEA